MYQDRPMVCRLWGTVESMACRWCGEPPGGFMPERAAALAMARVQELSARADQAS